MRGAISNTDANRNPDSHSYGDSNRNPYDDCNSYACGYAKCHTQRKRNSYGFANTDSNANRDGYCDSYATPTSTPPHCDTDTCHSYTNRVRISDKVIGKTMGNGR